MKACHLCLSTFEDNIKFCPFHGAELRKITSELILPGTSIGGYSLISKLGQDGLGEIFRAERGGESYRFRLFSSGLLCDPSRLDRLMGIFENNRQLTGSAVPFLEFGWTQNKAHLFCVNPFVPGLSLKDILDSGQTLSEKDVSNVLFQLLRAIRDIHAQRTAHGGLSLTNIILDSDGAIRLHDVSFWDVFRDENFQAIRDDNPGVFRDIANIMAPELVNGEAPKPCSDVFSAGAAAFELLARQPLYDGDVEAQILRRLENEDVPEIRLMRPDLHINEDFSDLLKTATTCSAGVRFQTVRAFIAALLGIHGELDPHAETISPALCLRLLGKDNVSEKVLSNIAKGTKHELLNAVISTARDTVIEHTRPGPGEEHLKHDTFETHDKTVVERAHWDDLDFLVGNDLPTSEEIASLERAVTTEMDPLEATPTREMFSVSFDDSPGGSLNDSIDSILSSLRDDFAPSHETDDTPSLSSLSSINKALRTNASLAESAADLQMQDAPTQSPHDKPADQSAPAQPSQDDAAQSAGGNVQRDDVLVMSASSEIRRVRRKKRRASTDVIPMGEVVMGEVEIASMVDPVKRPKYSKIPTLTSTGGFVIEDASLLEDALPVLTGAGESDDELESVQRAGSGQTEETVHDQERSELLDMHEDNEDWFSEGAAPKRSKVKRGLIITICILSLGIVGGVAAHIWQRTSPADTQTHEQNNNGTDAMIQAFYAHLEKATPESRAMAFDLLNQLRQSDIEREQLRECGKAFLDAMAQQASVLRELAKSHTAFPDPGPLFDENLLARTAECLAGIEETDPEAEARQTACESETGQASMLALADTTAWLKAMRTDMETSLESWQALHDIYSKISRVNRHHNPEVSGMLETSSHEQTALTARLQAVDTWLIANSAMPPGDKDNPIAVALVQEPTEDLAEDILVVHDDPPPPMVQPDKPSTNIAPEPTLIAQAAAPVNRPTTDPAIARTNAAAPPGTTPPTPQTPTTAQNSAASEPPAQVIRLVGDPPPSQATAQVIRLVGDPPPSQAPEKAPAPVQRVVLEDVPAPKKPATADTEPKKPATADAAVPTGKLMADAQTAMRANDFSLAVTLLEQAVKQEPNNGKAWFALARARDGQNNLTEAISSAVKACSLWNHASCHVYLGDLYSKSNQKDNARQSYEKAKALGGNADTIDAKILGL
ncbi:MAG: tetratricopeptide repeat protein [Proteobacteria bacterium]|nr:tetratricopeptide repeat protein [Pseudomonadota bacterium]